MPTQLLRIIFLLCAVTTFATAQTTNNQGLIPSDVKSVSSITPIFGELVRHNYPTGFSPIYEQSNANSYIQEHVLTGESITKWTQMLTIAATKGLASNPNITPLRLAQFMMDGFKKACPTTFIGESFGDTKIEGRDTFTAYLSCGTIKPTGEPHKTSTDAYSESMMLIVIKGEQSYFTVQWAERSTTSSTGVVFDPKVWSSRIKSLLPIKVCPQMPNEQAPYRSC